MVPDEPARTYLVERYWPGVTQESLRAARRRIIDAAHASGSPAAVRYVRSILFPTDEAVFCLFEASSIEAVAEVNRSAGVPFERITQALEVGDLL